MDAMTVPASGSEALRVMESAARVLACMDPSQLPDEEVARYLRVMERTDAMGAATRGRLLRVFDARNIHLADGAADHPGVAGCTPCG